MLEYNNVYYKVYTTVRVANGKVFHKNSPGHVYHTASYRATKDSEKLILTRADLTGVSTDTSYDYGYAQTSAYNILTFLFLMHKSG